VSQREMQPQYLRQLPAFLNVRKTKSTLACIGAFACEKVLADAGLLVVMQICFEIVLEWFCYG
jgi:hypothetical protein